MKQLLAGFALLLLVACAVSTVVPRAAVDPAALATELSRLPGAAVSREPLRFSYPGEVLFGRGAVLPMPGGIGLLDPLAEFFLRHPGPAWQVELRVQTEHGHDYDQSLAEKRSELLATYLLHKGVDLSRLFFQPEAAAGQPLVFTLKQPSATAKPEEKSGEKR